MAAMVPTNEAKIDMSDLKDAIAEWFHAMTGAFAHAAACRPSPYSQQNPQPFAASLTHAKDAVLGLFTGWLLVAGGMAGIVLYLTQSIDWPGTGVDFLLKVVNWL
jgi:hypothetical protein